MTEAVVSGKDTRCLFINNGDDLLTLKKVVSKKADKDDEKQKLNKSVETNGSELNGNHNKTDSINFDVDNTSSLEPNLEMDSDTDRNITIGSICTQEDRESETIDISNENSNEADTKNGEKDIQVNSIKCLNIPYSPSDSLDDNEYSHDLEDDDLELNNIRSPASYFNISSRAPLHSTKDLDTTLEDDILLLDEEVLISERKRKFEDLPEQEQKATKILKLWNLMKYPFQKITYGTSISEDEPNISIAEAIVEKENSLEPETAVSEDNSDSVKTEEKNTQNNSEADGENVDTSTNENTQKFCNIM
ncbi:protein ecdysoneless homolog [Rhopalosiphum padi]|uniref:protein ecdysoneless homolog n=1 Tax=Rhopalosiphum padi TaxID=40932 RepID=UPI00298E2034|nr:protein ecdysoneless homolog [Rhopalosiphum padi]